MNRFCFREDRFGYSMGYKSAAAAREAFDSMCAEGDMFPSEGRVESYNASNTSRRVTRWAITVATC